MNLRQIARWIESNHPRVIPAFAGMTGTIKSLLKAGFFTDAFIQFLNLSALLQTTQRLC